MEVHPHGLNLQQYEYEAVPDGFVQQYLVGPSLGMCLKGDALGEGAETNPLVPMTVSPSKYRCGISENQSM